MASIDFNNVVGVQINGKEVQQIEVNGRQVFADSIYKKLKLNLGSFHILGVAGGIVAGYTKNGSTYTCETYDLDTGEELTSFDYTFGDTLMFEQVKAFWAETALGEEFVFGIAYYSPPPISQWYWFFKHSDGSSIWNGFNAGSDLGCIYDSSTQTYKGFGISYSGKTLVVDGCDLYDRSTFSYSYTINNQYVTQIEMGVAVGNMIMLRCDNTNLPSHPNYYSVLWDCSNAITTNIWDNLTSVEHWTDYGANSGYWLMLGNGTYYLFKNTDLINPVQINGSYFPLSFGASDSVVYLYKSSEHAIYKLQSGTYTKLGGTASTFNGGLLDNTKQYMADTSGKIYYFDAS